MRSLAVIALILAAAGCSAPAAPSPADASGPPSAAPASSSPASPSPPSSPPSSPPPSSPPAASASSPTAAREEAEDIEGRFRLTLTLPRTTWASDEHITGEAVLALIDGDLAELSVAGNGPLEFVFTEIGGRREMGPAWDTVCDSARLTADIPIAGPIRKSGGYGEGEPDADFYRSFFTDPLVRLPAGDWDITAIAEFIDGRGCVGTDHSMRATVRVHVTE